ncbi:hypothetical protein PHAVU_003G191400 [Phaseolus vulgaris]|uniref:non-specific serine/threonine protein kinase n=1 Tax=Phaseolus vulgaris TaxID=3885 RepID=V7CD79_PHAVU|nr:hypothetical protein PHAVU_003G191400g [Phaseolus vulgaris]ESW27318.1 hypothetical protein PHAVU_003G191400g [Phaseolus vulgaris]
MGNCCGTRVKIDANLNPHPYPDVTEVDNRSTHLLVHSNPNGYGYIDEGKPEILPTPRSEGDILSSPHLKPFTLYDLKKATRNFQAQNLIGEGGFGNVYKGRINGSKSLGGTISGSGTDVAVKKLRPEGFQGHKEWLSEVNYLGQLHHQNLVELIGYCLEGDNRLLVYKYMPNGSLEDHIFRKGAQPLPWATRIKIATGAARGLSFLHDSKQQIIYRDFKASNILLDSEFNAKLSDFGLAKAGPTGDHSYVSTQVLGTHGYAAPEYIATGRLTARCDVYSFGVVLLELLSGRHAIDNTKSGVEHNLVEWARPYLGDRRKLFRIMDTKLEGQYPQRAAYTVAIIALQCICDAKTRPQMSEILSALEHLPAIRHSPSPCREDKPIQSPVREALSPAVNFPMRNNHPQQNTDF